MPSDTGDPARADGEWIADAYRLGALRGWSLAARGAMGEIYRLSTTRGDYAAKVFFWEAPDETRAESVVTFTANCRAAGVPSPTTERSVTGAPLTVHRRTGLVWQVQRWVPGRVPGGGDVPTAVWLAQQMATIHRLALPCGGDTIDEWYTEVRHDWQGLADHANQVGVPWAGGLAERATEFEALTALVNSVAIDEPVYCHRDVQANNTLLDDDGRRWLLDWDNCGPQEPWREFGNLLLQHVEDDDAVAGMAAAYREAGGLDWPQAPDLFATGLAVWLNFLHEQAHVALDAAADPGHRTFATEKVAALVAGMPSMQALERAAAVTRGLPG